MHAASQGGGDDSTYGAGDVRSNKQAYGGDGGGDASVSLLWQPWMCLSMLQPTWLTALVLLQGQYMGRSGGLNSDPSPTYGAAGATNLQARAFSPSTPRCQQADMESCTALEGIYM
jgi:hypothetical protein